MKRALRRIMMVMQKNTKKGGKIMTKQEFLSQVETYLTSNTGNAQFWCWYPLRSLTQDIPVAAFDLWQIYEDENIGQIDAVLRLLGIDTATAFQNQDYQPESKEVSLRNLLYEADADGYNFPWYVESYYYDHSKQWMIYTSHEFTITFAGKELAQAATQLIDSKYSIVRATNNTELYPHGYKAQESGDVQVCGSKE